MCHQAQITKVGAWLIRTSVRAQRRKRIVDYEPIFNKCRRIGSWLYNALLRPQIEVQWALPV